MKKHFPIFEKRPELIYLNNAATTQKPHQVLRAMGTFLSESYDTLGRTEGVLADEVYDIYTKSKQEIALWIEATTPMEIIPCMSATHASNMIIDSLIRSNQLNEGDVVITSVSEHHCVLVPLIRASRQVGFEIRYAKLNEEGYVDLDYFESLLDPRVKMVAIQHASNVTGAIQPLGKIRNMLHPSVIFVSDLTQSVPHGDIDVGTLGIDFGFFSGHKMCADTGIGILYAKKSWLKILEPTMVGGGAINYVTQEDYEIAGLPDRWEPGTRHLTGLVSLASAIEFLSEKLPEYKRENHSLISAILEKFENISYKGVQLIGPKTSENRLPVFSFVYKDRHPGDIAQTFSDKNIVLRSGHHCCQPLHEFFGVHATIRMSLYLYNDEQDVEEFFDILSSI